MKKFFLFVLIFLPVSVFAVKQLDVSIRNNNLYINSCSSQSIDFGGYKGYIDNVQVFATGQFGGYPCYSGDLFISNVSNFFPPNPLRPYHLSFDFYSSPDFLSPVFAHFNIYFDGSGYASFNDSTHIISFDVSTSTNSASVHSYISSGDVGTGVNFNISTSSESKIYTASTIYSTTTGDFYYTWNYPELVSFGDHTFYSDIASSTVLVSTSTVITLVEPPPKYSSVLFLPGIEASRLYRQARADEGGAEKSLWLPISDQDVKDLYLDANGKKISSPPNYEIYTRDVIDKAYGFLDIYGSFIDKLEEMKSVDKTIADYSAVPYDWRLSLDDILAGGVKTGENISYTETAISPYIIQELRRLAEGSKTGKVTIVAHSNGGLLTKALLKKLADTNDPLLQKIDKVIFVAVPQLGTPMAIPALLNGYNQGLSVKVFTTLSENIAREFGENLPGAYNLLPSDNYFTYVDNPVVKFDETMSDWGSKYGGVIHSKELLHNFLIDSYGRVESSSKDISTPSQLRENILSSAETVHSTLDSWVAPAGLSIVEIAGWGVPTTLSGVEYYKDDGKIELKPITTIDGDGTVVTPSALWGAGASGISRYWVNLKSYNSFINKVKNLRLNTKHADILGIPELQTLVSNIILATSTDTLPTYISTSTPQTGSNDTRLIYSLHSPLTLDIYDDLGNHTGISTTTNKLEEQIPGTYFIQFGEDKYIFTDTTTPIHISMTGYDTGTFTFDIEQKQEDNTISTVTFKDIPTASTTRVSITAQSDINTLSDLSIDTDNNGSPDITLKPVINGVVTYTPPKPKPSPIIEQPLIPVGSNGPIIQSTIPVTGSDAGTQTVQTVVLTEKDIKSEVPMTNDQSSLETKPAETTSLPEKTTKATQTINQDLQNNGQENIITNPKNDTLIDQGARVVSADRGYLSWFWNFLKRIASWFVGLFN